MVLSVLFLGPFSQFALTPTISRSRLVQVWHHHFHHKFNPFRCHSRTCITSRLISSHLTSSNPSATTMSTRPLLPLDEKHHNKSTPEDDDWVGEPVFPLPSTLSARILAVLGFICSYCILIFFWPWDISWTDAFVAEFGVAEVYFLLCMGFPFQPGSNWRKGLDRDGKPWGKRGH